MRTLKENGQDIDDHKIFEKTENRVLELAEKIFVRMASAGRGAEQDVVKAVRAAYAFVDHKEECEEQTKQKKIKLLNEERDLQK